MVAMNVWPTDAADGSVSSEARWRKMARLWAPSGVARNIGGELAPTLAFPNLTIKSGAAWVDGAYCELPGDQVLAVTANGLVVVRFDPAANTADLVYRDGVTVPAQDPNGTWELPIAAMIGSAVTDLRNRIAAGDAARGVLGFHQLFTNFTTIAPHTNVQPTGVTVTVPSEPVGHRIRATLLSNPYGAVSPSGVRFYIERNSVGLTNFDIPDSALSTIGSHAFMASAIIPSSVGGTNVVYRVTQCNNVSNNAVSDFASANWPRWLLVEDLG